MQFCDLVYKNSLDKILIFYLHTDSLYFIYSYKTNIHHIYLFVYLFT